MSVIDRSQLAVRAGDTQRVTEVDIAGTIALVVDDVYENPDYVRGLALGLDFYIGAGLYPGFMARVSISAHQLLALVNTALLNTGVSRMGFAAPNSREFLFAIITRPGRDLAPGQGGPHVDSFCDYAGVLYLNPPEQCQGGTAFWRHCATGLQLAPREAGGARSVARLTDEIIGYPQGSTDAWEMTDVLAMKYNRLVVYRADLLHSPLYDEARFGNTLRERRLTQNLYFSVVAEPGGG